MAALSAGDVGGPLVEFVLRTFAFGQFAQRGSPTPGSRRPLVPAEAGTGSEKQPASSSSSASSAEVWQCVSDPTELPGTPGFTTLACGRGCCVGITPEGDVHDWRVGHRGSAALGQSFSMEWSLSVLQDEIGQRMQLRDLSLGQASLGGTAPGSVNAIALMDGGDVYTCQSLEESDRDSGWRPVAHLTAHLVVSVACGAGFCTALTARGELLSWGESFTGALGLLTSRGACVTRVAAPSIIGGELAGLRIAAVGCGEQHVVAATLDEVDKPGAVYSWGCGTDMRLGYACEKDQPQQSEPRQVEWFSPSLGELLKARREASDGYPVDERSLRASDQPQRNLKAAQRVTQVGCGSRHTAILCQGGLIVFGEDDYGQLGRIPGDVARSSEVSIDLPPCASAPLLYSGSGSIESSQTEDSGAGNGVFLHELAAKRLACGPLHTAAVSADGQLHVWGADILTPWETEGGTAIEAGARRGVQRVAGFGPRQPVVTLACGAHFVMVSAEVELSVSTGVGGDALLQPGRLCGSQTGHAWRPANLPPKEVDEVMRHAALVRDLERHAEQKQEREAQADRIRLDRQQRREQRLREETDLWLQQLLPQYSPGSPPSRRMEKLWRQGLPPRVREVLWPQAIGNVLKITPQLFEIYKEQAREARKAHEADSDVFVALQPRSTCGREQSTKCIPLDLPRTFPTLAFFCKGGPLHDDCIRILEAYTFFRPDIGYVQGMSFLAAVLLLYLQPYPAFVGFCNLINSPSILGLYRLEPQAVACRAELFNKLCAFLLPEVAVRVEEAGLTPEMFLIEWFMTLFSKCLPIDVASVIWDLFLLDGEVVLYCTAIALLQLSETQLLSEDGEDLGGCSKILGEDLRLRAADPDEMLTLVQEVQRRSPPQLLAEIRNIEQSEFGTSLPGTSQPSVFGAGGASARGFLGGLGQAVISKLRGNQR
eukprot:TRINITY_DN74530_c0_g1_i1.p1 TRINITY_DN74530_c0_g1~~TRINITY_DN74530_c0_g1_i1.p1  ORF type:complete len:939 (-),score=171.09 TRINITY_DN74530_c0_g1_i1:390-3206(-)